MLGKVMVCATCKPPPDNYTSACAPGCSCILGEHVSAGRRAANRGEQFHLPPGRARPEASCVLEVQSVPPEGTTVKFVEAATFDTFNCWLPESETVTVCGALVEPTLVLAKS